MISYTHIQVVQKCNRWPGLKVPNGFMKKKGKIVFQSRSSVAFWDDSDVRKGYHVSRTLIAPKNFCVFWAQIPTATFFCLFTPNNALTIDLCNQRKNFSLENWDILTWTPNLPVGACLIYRLAIGTHLYQIVIHI